MKRLTVKNQIQKSDIKDIKLFEDKKEIVFPDKYMQFISTYGAARIKENVFNGDFYIQNILPLNSEQNASIELILTAYLEEHKTKDWLSFAIDPGGWVFVMSLSEESFEQLFIDKFDSGEENPFLFIANSFEEFINNFKPEI